MRDGRIPETRYDAYKGFAQMSDADDEADHPGVKLIGRWHDLVAGGGVLICESADISAVQSFALNWIRMEETWLHIA